MLSTVMTRMDGDLDTSDEEELHRPAYPSAVVWHHTRGPWQCFHRNRVLLLVGAFAGALVLALSSRGSGAARGRGWRERGSRVAYQAAYEEVAYQAAYEAQALPAAATVGHRAVAQPRTVLEAIAGGNANEQHAWWRTFSTAAEAFRFLDRNGDGVLDFEGDGLRLSGNSTLHVDFFEFEQYFLAEHQKMISEQGLRKPKTSLAVARYGALVAVSNLTVPDESPRPMQLKLDQNGSFIQRLVTELYTFGAPGVAQNYLYDATQARGCIPGLRVFSRGFRFTPGYGISFAINDPVSWITAAFNYDHAKMDSLELMADNHEENRIRPCSSDYDDVVQTPPRDNFWWFAGHMVYERALRAHRDRALARAVEKESQNGSMRRLRRAYEMSHFSMANYQGHTPKLALDAKDLQWALVARACSQKYGFYAPRCEDHVTLYQEPETLECALVFEGTDDGLDVVADLNIHLEEFCSFGPVHRGFKRKLMRMIRGVDYQQVIRRKLPKCGGLTVAGHSLGGAQAELFAACANRAVPENESGFEDFRYIFFDKGSPERLPPFFADQAKGFFFRNKGSGLCLDVRGIMQTDYETPINLYDCEFLDADYYKDQHWAFTPDGFLVNGLSHKCLDVQTVRRSRKGEETFEVRQQSCEFDTARTGQRWDMTSDGFLRNRLSGFCLGATLALVFCPFTDQKWDVQPDGYIVNQLSGKCLDVAGRPGTADKSPLLLWPCENETDTDQRWKLTAEGTLKNLLSGKCAGVRYKQGRESTPMLVLTPCQASIGGDTLTWNLSADGFLRDTQTGKCLDVEGLPGTGDGGHIQLATCEEQRVETPDRWLHMESGFLRNIGDDKTATQRCLEVFGERGTDEKRRDGAKLHLTLCKVTTDQKWELTEEGYVKNVIGGQKCLDIDRRGTRDSLWLQNCEQPGDPALYWEMKWRLMPDGAIKNFDSGECIDVKGAPGTKDGSEITTWRCEGQNSTDQRWRMMDDGLIVNTLSMKCLDVMGVPGTTEGAPLLLSHCEEGVKRTDQHWELTEDGFLVNKLSGKCVVRGKTGLILHHCPTTAQRWELTEAGLLRNRQKGLCIDAAQNHSFYAAKPFWDLMVWPCDAKRSFQQWERIEAASLGLARPAIPADCGAHPRCAALGLAGRCCPNKAGTMLPCCSGWQAPEVNEAR